MKRQPDFQGLISEYFGGGPQKLVYEVREDFNSQYDIIVLSGLIHDARFKPSDVKLKGKRLTIDLNRDCWELPMQKTASGSELHIADSRLTITSVVNLEWNFSGSHNFAESNELWIMNVRYSSDEIRNSTCSVLDNVRHQNPKLKGDFVFSFPTRVSLYGWSWSLHVTLVDDKIKLSDKETPYLYSERHKSANRKS